MIKLDLSIRNINIDVQWLSAWNCYSVLITKIEYPYERGHAVELNEEELSKMMVMLFSDIIHQDVLDMFDGCPCDIFPFVNQRKVS